jgi:hypothetical protein
MLLTPRHDNYDSLNDIIRETFLRNLGPFIKGINQTDEEIYRFLV